MASRKCLVSQGCNKGRFTGHIAEGVGVWGARSVLSVFCARLLDVSPKPDHIALNEATSTACTQKSVVDIV